MPEKNKARFDKLEAEWLKDGNQVSNAQRIAVSLEKMPYSEFFGELFSKSCKCDAIALVSGWEASERVRQYVLMWINLGIPLYNAETKKLLPKFDKVDIIYKLHRDEEETKINTGTN